MIPNKKGSDDCDFPKVLTACFKETQTNNGIITDISQSSTSACNPTSDNIENKDVTIIHEFSHIIQNSSSPDSVILIKDSFSEEVTEHFSDSSIDEVTGNRYKYCREVIKPHLQTYPSGCPRSEEQLITDILDSVHEDFPDYKSCFEDRAQKKDSLQKKDSKSKENFKPTARTTENKTKTNGFSEMADRNPCPSSKKPKCQKSSKRDGCPPTSGVCEDSPMDGTPPSIPCKAVSSPTINSIKMPAGICKITSEDECKPNTDQNPIKKESTQSVSSRKSSGQTIDHDCTIIETFKSFMDAHNEAIKTIRVAAEDVFEKVYVASKDAINDLAAKSSAHSTVKKSQCNATDQNLKQTSEKKSTETITRCKLIPDQSHDKNSDSDEKLNRLFSPDVLLQQMVKKVDSTMSQICDNVDFEKLANFMKTSRELNDYKSKYDVPNTPKEMTIEEGISFFSVIKSKICSIFRDDNNIKGSDANTSSNSDEK